jgi:serine/threonine protein phosphatase PrpC
MPCQDGYGIAIGSVAGSPYIVAAVADGHGDAKHDLSQYGAALAVRAALDQVRALYVHLGQENSASTLWRNFKADYPRRVGRCWRDAVLEDARGRLSAVPALLDESHELWTRYGTTLLAALIAPEAILVGQLGDGDIAFLRTDGSIESPIKKDPSLVGTATYSLCSPEATQLWQTAMFQRGTGGLLLLATDGLSDAFGGDEDQFHTFVRRLDERIKEHGMERVAASIPNWLDAKYSKASGDDITLTLVKVHGAEVEQPKDGNQAVERRTQNNPGEESTDVS